MRINADADKDTRRTAQVIKPRVGEKMYLESITKYMQELVSVDECYLVIRLDMEHLTLEHITKDS
jgi:hypothetical protein